MTHHLPLACLQSSHSLRLCFVPAAQRLAVRRSAAAAVGRTVVVAVVASAVSLALPCGTTLAMPQASLIIGSAANADLQLEGSNIAAQHARLERKGGRLFCTALEGDPDLLLAPTHCWLDGVELRLGVSHDTKLNAGCEEYQHRCSVKHLRYLVAPGTRIAIGQKDNCVTCTFEEGGSSAMAEMLLKGLAASASKEVREKLDM